MFNEKKFHKKTILFRLSQKLKTKHPYVSNDEIKLAFNGLFVYFQICQQYHFKNTPIPSFIVDELWRDFILETHDYAIFCEEYIGYFFHYVPFDSVKPLNNSAVFPADKLLHILKDYSHTFLIRDLNILSCIDSVFETKQKEYNNISKKDNRSPFSILKEIIKKLD